MAETVSTRIALPVALHQRLVVEAGMQRMSQNSLLLQILEEALPSVASVPKVPQAPRELTATMGTTGRTLRSPDL